jgi:NitT/TauT family transport system ATP-binding protein
MLHEVVKLRDSRPAPKSGKAGQATDRGHIVIDHVAVRFGDGPESHLAVTDTSLEMKPGEFVCILGPSGCGKSTLLNCIAGYVKPTSGTVRVDDKPITGPGPDRGMVFQQYSLFPWKTIKENVAFGPKVGGSSANGAESIANTFLAMVGLSNFADRYPAELSGGMQQRVGIARALANYPSVLLMDEPFGALDAQTRLMMQENLLGIWSEFRTTVVFVTHDVDEAVFLADRILVMSAAPGKIIDDITVDLDRPRDPVMATDRRFIEIKKHCLEMIRAESLKAFEQQNR